MFEVLSRSIKKAKSSTNTEYEQSIIRIIIGFIFLFWFLFWAASQHHNPSSKLVHLLIGFIVFSILLNLHITAYPATNPIRRRIAILSDMITPSLCMIYAGDVASIMFGIYLWSVLGHSIRYGERYLYFTQITCFVGFLSVVIFSDYWRSQPFLSYGLLVTIVVIPIYFGKLIKRDHASQLEAKRANLAKSEFIANMSHEMRTPLNGVIGIINILKGQDLSTENLKRYINALEASAIILVKQIEDVLDIAKIEAGKDTVNECAFDIYELISTVVNAFMFSAQEKNIFLEFEAKELDHRFFITDPNHFQHVITNLIGNAIKFTSIGGVRVQIKTVASTLDKSTLRIDISDTGIGIPLEAQSKIFQPFTQADSSTTREYGGTGLGTTIAKHHIEIIGGSIGLNSKINEGSTFWISIELTKADPYRIKKTSNVTPFQVIHSELGANVLAMSSDNPINQSKKNSKQVSILVAEDNQVNQLVVQGYLKPENYLLTIANDGQEAIDLIPGCEFDVIILDMNMPKFNGIEVAGFIRLYETKYERIPIVMLSANATPSAKEEAKKVGVDAFLTKPVNQEELIKTVAAMVEKRRNNPQRELLVKNRKNITDLEILDFDKINRVQNTLGAPFNWYGSLVKDYLPDSEVILIDLKKALNDENYNAFNTCLHTWKSTSEALAAKALTEVITEAYSLELHDLKMHGEQIVKDIEYLWPKTKAAMSKYLNSGIAN